MINRYMGGANTAGGPQGMMKQMMGGEGPSEGQPREKSFIGREIEDFDPEAGVLTVVDAGGKEFQIRVPKGFQPEEDAEYTAVLKDGEFVLEDDRFGPRELPGQRGDAFGGGPEPGESTGSEPRASAGGGKPDMSALMKMLKSARSSAEGMAEGGRSDESADRAGSDQRQTYAGQYMDKIQEDEGGKYGIYDHGDGRKTKVYFDQDPGEVGEYVPDNDYFFFVKIGDRIVARKAPGFAGGGKTYRY